MWFDKARLHRGLGTGANLCHRLGDDVQGSWAEISREVRGSWAAPAQVRPEVTVRPLRRDVKRQRAGDDRDGLRALRTSGWQCRHATAMSHVPVRHQTLSQVR